MKGTLSVLCHTLFAWTQAVLADLREHLQLEICPKLISQLLTVRCARFSKFSKQANVHIFIMWHGPDATLAPAIKQ